MDTRSQREEEILDALRQLESEAERHAYLDQACAGDPQLRRDLQALFEAHRADTNFLGAIATTPGDPALTEGPGTMVGRYKILQLIGEGGMGAVYMADQEEPVRRRVALKIIKVGMDTKQVVARFEAERQALALMDHPNIARVLDGGATGQGRPYFVMELVRGVPITKFCDENKLTTRERLKLFLPVCQAVQHAHQKGIIHRDLKPSNILVTLDYGEPTAKVIDFGIAKATNQKLTEKTLFTQFGQMIGTPAYMSPEQADMTSLDIDTRTDVYSLGTLLYELLTGGTPFPEERLRSAGFLEMQRIIKEEEPIRPSTRVSTMQNGARRTWAARHGGESVELFGFRSDLDWIVLKSIEKDRRRRYDTPIELFADLRRHLDHEPVSATPPTLPYKAHKFVQRNRLAVAASAAVGAALLLGLAASVWQAFRATRAEREARASQREAEKQTEVSQAVIDFLTKDILAAGNVWDAPAAPTKDLTLRTVLERARANIEKRFQDQPLVEATVRSLLLAASGNPDRQVRIGEHRRVYELFFRELGPNHEDTLKAQWQLGHALCFSFSLDRKNAETEEGLKLLQDAENAAARVLGESHDVTFDAMRLLGTDLCNEGRLTEAEPILEKALRLTVKKHGDDHEKSLSAKYTLAFLRSRQGRLAESYLLDRNVLEGYRKIYGHRHLWVANLLREVGYYTATLDRDFESAARLLQEGLDISKELNGIQYPTGALLNDLLLVRLEERSFLEAKKAAREQFFIFEREYGPANAETVGAARRLNAIFGRLGEWSALASELEDQRARGIMDSASLAEELLARSLAGNNAGDLGIWDALRGRNREESLTAYETAKMLLALPNAENDLSRVVPFLSRVAEEKVDWRARVIWNPLIRGMNAVRQHNYPEAEDQLSNVAHNYADRRAAALARYFTAISLHGRGEIQRAKTELASASQLLGGLLRAGDLDLPEGQGSWSTLACALVVRDQAERLILGRIASPRVTKESLEDAQKAWKAVHDQLVASMQAAQRRDYPAARDSYLQARRNSNYELEAAIEDLYVIEFIPAVLAQTGDRQNLVRFVREAVRENDPLYQPYFLALSCFKAELPPEVVARIRQSVSTEVEFEKSQIASRKEHPRYWESHNVGVALYRFGELNLAFDFLQWATGSENNGCALNATAYAGLAAWKLGRRAEAKKLITQAEEGFRVTVEAAGGRMVDWPWKHLLMTDLALEEARDLMAGQTP